MALIDTEKSYSDGEPVELYTFTAGSSVWRYCNSDSTLTFNNIDYTGINIARGNIEQSQDIARSSQNITMDAKQELLLPYKTTPLDYVVLVKIERGHLTDPNSGLFTVWQGRVLNVTFKDEANKAELKCESVYTSVLRPVNRRFFQSNCPHVLYGDNCKVSRAIYSQTVTLQSISGLNLNSPAFSAATNNYYAGGYVELDKNGQLQRRYIVESTNTYIKINFPFSGISQTDTVTVYAGCDHSLQTCKNRFNNTDNFGGQPYVPNKNPFKDPIF